MICRVAGKAPTILASAVLMCHAAQHAGSGPGVMLLAWGRVHQNGCGSSLKQDLAVTALIMQVTRHVLTVCTYQNYTAHTCRVK